MVVWVDEDVIVKCLEKCGCEVLFYVENEEFLLIKVDFVNEFFVIEGIVVGVIWNVDWM